MIVAAPCNQALHHMKPSISRTEELLHMWMMLQRMGSEQQLRKSIRTHDSCHQVSIRPHVKYGRHPPPLRRSSGADHITRPL